MLLHVFCMHQDRLESFDYLKAVQISSGGGWAECKKCLET